MNLSDDQIYRMWSGGKRTYNMRASKTPCPGCGQTGKHRPADKVCLECFKDLLEIKELREHMQAEGANAEVLALPFAPHGLPYVPHEKDRREEGVPNVQESFFNLLQSLGKPTSGDDIEFDRMIESEKSYSSDSPRHPKIYPKGTQKLARDLYSAILRLADAAYERGFNRGDDLLGNLAKGEVTVKDYEAQVKRETSAWKDRR
jgi:hypothetical protein